MKTMKQMMLSRATFVILLSNVPLTLLAQDNLTYSALASTPLKQMKEVYTTYTTDISKLSQDEQFYHLTNQYSLDFDFEMNYHVAKEIELYKAINNAYVRKSLKNGSRYLPLIEQILESKNMPLALKYLPAIESKMNPYAKSYRGAAGIWQIMPATARELKLRVNSRIDERRNVPKSTDKATKYLQRLYKINNNWTLTIAAYNCGQGNVNKAIRKAGSRNYWELRHFLPHETQRYIPRFFAIVYLMEKYDMDNTPNGNLVTYTIKEHKMIEVQPALKVTDFNIRNNLNVCNNNNNNNNNNNR